MISPRSNKNIAVFGGAGYIGSHVTYSLLKNGYTPVIVDDFSTSSENNISTIRHNTGNVEFWNIDISEKDFALSSYSVYEKYHTLNEYNFDAIILLAASKSVPASFENPLNYYRNNLNIVLNTLYFAKERGIKKIIFSSSSSVYGNPNKLPVTEESPLDPLSPYARSKMYCEGILNDVCKKEGISLINFRYFNVGGNLKGGSIGNENIHSDGLLTNLLNAYIEDKPFEIYGNDYETRDGTPLRDIIHVEDIVDAHLKGLKYLDKHNGQYTFNLGTGKGVTVMEVFNELEKIVGSKLRAAIAPRRKGDVIRSLANSDLAEEALKWKAKRSIKDILISLIKWYENGLRGNG